MFFFSDEALSQCTDFLTKSKVCQDMFIEFNKEFDRLDNFISRSVILIDTKSW